MSWHRKTFGNGLSPRRKLGSLLRKALVAITFTLSAITSLAEGLRISNATCDYLTNPDGIDTLKPRLRWQVDSTERGQKQSAYRVLVASSRSVLDSGQGDVWDTGRTVSDHTSVRFDGVPLNSAHEYFWKVKSWDKHGSASPWSVVSRWFTGLMREADWHGRWIGADADEDPRNRAFGYQSQPSRNNVMRSVLIDLGSVQSVSKIVLHPATLLVGVHTPGYGFPLRFRIEASTGSQNQGVSYIPSFKLIRNESDQDFPNPGYESRSFDTPGLRARFVRVVAVSLWKDPLGTDVPYRFALGEVEVFSSKRNIAYGKTVIPDSSVESGGWGARFLVDGVNRYEPLAGHAGDAAVQLGRAVVIPKPIKRAVAFLAGIGYSEFTINGQKVSDRVLDPGFTDYTKRVGYTTFDVTSQLKLGRNLLGILLGNGWYHLPTADLFGFEQAPWTAPPQALMNLIIEFADGTTQTVVTDKQWSWATGPIVYNSVRGGETIDLTQKPIDWSFVGSPGRGWRSVKIVAAPAGKLRAQEEQPVRITESISAVTLTEPKAGVYLFNFGVNLTGWVRFVTSGTRGDRVTLQFNEKLQSDGTLDAYHEAKHHTYGRFQTGELVLSGRDEDVFEPRFTYHSFQYVQVTGLRRRPSLKDVVAQWVHTDFAQTGEFKCSNSHLNAIQAAILRTQRNYVIGYPNDPLREKMGWTQDIWNDFNVGVLNFDIAPVYRRWFHDLLDAQDNDGHEPSIAPTSGWGRSAPNGEPGELSDVWWGGAIVYLPWLWYQQYDDTDLMEEGYDAGKRYLAYLQRNSDHDLLNWGLGDWGDEPGGGFPVHTPRPQTTSAGFYYLAEILSHEATLLNHSEDSKEFASLAERIREAYNLAYFDLSTGAYRGDSQTSQALPLLLDMELPQYRGTVVKALVRTVRQADDHLRTGFVGLRPLLQTLTENNESQIAYKIATQEDVPGWWGMIKDGATTVSEYWDPHTGTRNLLNLAGPAGAWYYEALVGIRLDPTSPGYKHAVIAPQIVDGLTWAQGRTRTIHGTIECEWHRDGNRLRVDVIVPANTTATVMLPLIWSQHLHEVGTSTSLSQGLLSKNPVGNVTSFEIDSGIYHFDSMAENAEGAH